MLCVVLCVVCLCVGGWLVGWSVGVLFGGVGWLVNVVFNEDVAPGENGCFFGSSQQVSVTPKFWN